MTANKENSDPGVNNNNVDVACLMKEKARLLKERAQLVAENEMLTMMVSHFECYKTLLKHMFHNEELKPQMARYKAHFDARLYKHELVMRLMADDLPPIGDQSSWKCDAPQCIVCNPPVVPEVDDEDVVISNSEPSAEVQSGPDGININSPTSSPATVNPSSSSENLESNGHPKIKTEPPTASTSTSISDTSFVPSIVKMQDGKQVVHCRLHDCPETFATLAAELQHFSQHCTLNQTSGRKLHRCPECKGIFSSKQSCFIHMLRDHEAGRQMAQ